MKIITFIQNVAIWLGVGLLILIPAISFVFPMSIPIKSFLFFVSFFAVFLVMIVRPLSDIFPSQMWLKRLIILRKGFGILSASIIVGFMLQALLAPGSPYLVSLLSGKFFSLEKYALFAHLGDLSGVILLVTSNRLSQQLLRTYWKRIQKLSYVYFYAGGIYEAFFLDSTFALYALAVVTSLTIFASGIKIIRREESLSVA